jgi:hypothetical protein
MPPNGSKIRRGEAPQVGVACENSLLDLEQFPGEAREKSRPWSSRSATAPGFAGLSYGELIPRVGGKNIQPTPGTHLSWSSRI